MNDLAQNAGLAKGTLYLYFTTKEQLFLAMLEERLTDLLLRMENALAGLRPGNPRTVAEAIVVAVAQDWDVLPLMLLWEPVLEHNVDLQSVLEFRRRLTPHLDRLGQRLESTLPELRGRGVETLVQLRAYMAGVQQMVSSPPEVLSQVSSDAALKRWSIDRNQLIAEGLLALLGGANGSLPGPLPEARDNAAAEPRDTPAGAESQETSPWQRRF